ncbi:MAG: zinc metallopeptidase [Clostridia bacterium]|nr:zinc metallopeptidase [Clostridia bacterium]
MFSYQYILYMLPAMLFALWAQLTVSSTFKKYRQVANQRGMSGADAARAILDASGLRAVRIERVSGNLTDHYDPRTNVIRLSDSVYASRSVGAIGVAAHEAGHAVQHAVGYGPIKLRQAILPACQFGSTAAPYLILLGLALSMVEFYIAGIVAFILVAFFQLVTLPVEFNASRRALAALSADRGLSESDLKGAKKVLRAAAMTYVAALVTSFMQILYYLSRLNRRRD